MQLVKDRRDKEIRAKLTSKELDEVKGQANMLGMTISDFVRYCITKVINEG